LTGMDIGKYNGYMQVGMKDFYEAGNAWEVSFMAPETFTRGAELNGLPEADKVDTLQINSFDQLPATPAGLQTYQGRLVRFNNVEWQNGGVETYSTYHSSGVSQNIVDINGQTLAARTSGYSNFWNQTLPEGRGDVVCILGYYGSAWQLTLIDGASSMNFGNPTTQPGTESNPYSVAEAVAAEAAGTAPAGLVWVKGYIVGTVAPEVENVESNDDIEWGSDPVLANTVVISSDPQGKDIADALVLALPAGSVMREYVNIQAHPENVGKELAVRGRLETYMGTFGITGNTGTSAEFKLEGVEIGSGIPAGDGQQATPFNPAQVIAANPTSTSSAPEGYSSVWVKGYIVGSMPADGTYIDKTIFGAAAELKTNIVLAPTADCSDASKCIGIQLPNNDIRAKLNLMDNPANLGKAVSVLGDVMKYCGGPGVKNVTNYVLEGVVTPDPDPVTATLYSETWQDGSLGKFTVENKIESAWSGWYAKTNSTPYCAMANSYTNGSNVAAESWLISPTIGLQGCSNISMSVKQGFGFYFPTAQDEYFTVLVQVEGGEWTPLTLTNYPTKGNGNWSSSFAENTFDFNAYAGKTIRVAFRYINDGATSRAWELQDFAIKGEGSAVIGGTVTPDP
ncbi:MAG: choice-of-anchor J domain-containing protein, partial [Muribaculaceae bacterium]|nr:choice-of-anchor J domain-containing protein [Muribaculaceae bacterium]